MAFLPLIILFAAVLLSGGLAALGRIGDFWETYARLLTGFMIIGLLAYCSAVA